MLPSKDIKDMRLCKRKATTKEMNVCWRADRAGYKGHQNSAVLSAEDCCIIMTYCQ